MWFSGATRSLEHWGGDTMPLRFENSPCVHAPLGLYSHTVCVPEGTELVALLEAQNLAPTDIVKLRPRDKPFQNPVP